MFTSVDDFSAVLLALVLALRGRWKRDGEATGRNRGRTSKPRQNALENTGSGGIVACREALCIIQREGGIYVRICVAKPLNLSVGPLDG